MAVRRLAIHVAQVVAWLVTVRDRRQHGKWLPWLLENGPDISQRTAYNHIETYEEMLKRIHRIMLNVGKDFFPSNNKLDQTDRTFESTGCIEVFGVRLSV
jgi:hypothetical protein